MKKSYYKYYFITLIILISFLSCNKNKESLENNPDSGIVDFSISRTVINVGDTIKLTKLHTDFTKGKWECVNFLIDNEEVLSNNTKEYVCRIIAKPGIYNISLVGSNTVTKQISVVGGNWTKHSCFGKSGTVLNLGNNIFVISNGNKSTAPILRSSDFGNTWDSLGHDLPYDQFTNRRDFEGMTVLDNNIFIVATSNGNQKDLYKSTNYGSTWSLTCSGIPGYLYAFNNKLYLTYFGSIFESTNEGISWNSIGGNIPNSAPYSIRELIFYNNSYYAIWRIGYVGFNNELWKNDGNSWNKINLQGLNGSIFYIISTDQNQFFATADSGFYRSSDNGINWTKIQLQRMPQNYFFYDNSPYYILKSYNNNIIIAQINYAYSCKAISNYYSQAGGGLISLDNGLSWKWMGLLSFGEFVVIGDKIYTSAYDGCFYSCQISDFQ